MEMFEVGGVGKDRDAVEEAQQWAVGEGCIGKKEAVVTLQAWQDLAIRKGRDPQHIVIEMGVGWAGATEGFRMVFSRTVGIDWKRQNIGDKGWTQPDFLREFQKATKWKGGIVRGMADRAGTRTKDTLCSFGSMRFDKQLKKYFGEGVVVQGCAYGGRQTGKAYRFWMAAKTLEAFQELQTGILSNDIRSHCSVCKAGGLRTQTACPQKGANMEREGVLGELKKVTKNRV